MKKIIIFVFLLLLMFFISTYSLTLVKHRDRINDYSLNKELINKLNCDTKGLDAVEIMNYSIKLTAQYLQFSEHNNINVGKANCIGYAKLCSSICNYALQINGIEGYAKPVVGYVKSNGINICSLLVACAPTSKWNKWKLFVKDHDFVEFYFGNQIIFADPCAYDLIGIDCKTFKSTCQ